jgi:hypothetical protein
VSRAEPAVRAPVPPRLTDRSETDPEGTDQAMDVRAIDENYQQLENQSQQTIAALSRLSQKLQNAGGPDAREWQLDLREIALQIQQEQNQVTSLLQAIHGFVANQAQQPAFQPQQRPQQAPPQYQQAQQGYQQQANSGGALHNFLGGGFGQAIVRGAGFGIGDDLINHLFN